MIDMNETLVAMDGNEKANRKVRKKKKNNNKKQENKRKKH